MDRADVDRNLLFGLLALQTGLIDRPCLSRALRTWVADKSRDLADVLAEQGALADSVRSALAALVGELVRTHEDDPTRSLAAVEAGASTREMLVEVGDPDVEATVDAIGSATTEYAQHSRAGDFHAGTSTAGSARFRVLRPHKQGGLGAVFVALDSELNREVALKQILDHHADDPVSRARFLLEAEITGGLEHPGIVPVYGLGHFDDGRPYYAMRFIRGDSLKQAIADFHGRGQETEEALPPEPRELSFRRLLRRFLDVCNAVEYAHRRGVLHRDLKPGNVMVGKYGETLVVDWGLAKAVGMPDHDASEGERALSPSHSSGTIETLPGSAMGTPSYMSPEQAAGDLGKLGPRSDVYSLGATLYCLLTGRPPYEGPNAAAVLLAVRLGSPTPPRKLQPSVDRALEAVCLKAMALDAENRYASPAALAEQVERWMADEPVDAFAESKARRLGRWGRRHSSMVSGAGVFLIGAVVALGLLAWLIGRHNARLELARQEARVAGAMAHKAVRTLLSDVVRNELLNIPQGEMLRVKLSERALELYRDFVELHPDDPDFGLEQARIEEQVAGLYRMIGRYELSQSHDEAAITRLKPLILLHPDRPDLRAFLAYTEDQLAELLKMAGRGDAEAEPHHVAAVRLAAELWDHHPEVASYARLLGFTSNDLAGMLTNAGRHDEALPVLDRGLAAALAFRATLPKEPVPDKFTLDWIVLPMIQTTRGCVLARLGRTPEAVAAITPAVDSLRVLNRTYPTYNDITWLFSSALQELGNARAAEPARIGEALRDLDEAVTLLTPLLARFPGNASYPKLLVTLRLDRGATRLLAGQFGPASEDLNFADDKLADRLRGGDKSANPLREHARVKAGLARLAARGGDRDRARTLAGEAVDLQTRALALAPDRKADRDLLQKHQALREELVR